MTEPRYQVFKYSIEPGKTVHIPFTGNFVRCIEASDEFKIRFGNSAFSFFRTALEYRSESEFSSVAVSNDTANVLKVTLAIGAGGITDSSLNVAEGLSIFNRAARSIRSGFVTVGPGERVQVLNTDTERLQAFLTSHAFRFPVFLGGSTVAGFSGLPLAAKSTATLKTQSPVFAYNQSRETIKIAIFEELTT